MYYRVFKKLKKKLYLQKQPKLLTMNVIKPTPGGHFDVGYYDPTGQFVKLKQFDRYDTAALHVSVLNGGIEYNTLLQILRAVNQR